MSDWLKKHDDATQELLQISFELLSLANAFRTTGNDVMFQTLKFIANDIESAQKIVSGAVSESINENLKHSQEQSKVVLEAALSGILSGGTPPVESGVQ